ncbi:MAG TPA: hypothetical protein VGO62_02900 [Myxococcota bacterium]
MAVRSIFRILVAALVLGCADFWRAPITVTIVPAGVTAACVALTMLAAVTSALAVRGASIVLAVAALALALVYFFPGVHKLADAGSPFLDGEALMRLIRLKSVEASAAVPFALDEHRSLLLVGGAVVVVAELAMLPLALWRPRIAFVVALGLHACFTIAFHMPFTLLVVATLVFALAADERSATMSSRSSSLVCAIVIGGATVAGALGAMSAYPFACYPTFATPVPVRVLDVRVDVERAGAWVPLARDLTAPLDVRTQTLARARAIRTSDDGAAFFAWRMRDARFAAAVAGGRARVVLVDFDLGFNRALGERAAFTSSPGG